MKKANENNLFDNRRRRKQWRCIEWLSGKKCRDCDELLLKNLPDRQAIDDPVWSCRGGEFYWSGNLKKICKSLDKGCSGHAVSACLCTWWWGVAHYLDVGSDKVLFTSRPSWLWGVEHLCMSPVTWDWKFQLRGAKDPSNDNDGAPSNRRIDLCIETCSQNFTTRWKMNSTMTISSYCFWMTSLMLS